MSVDTKIFGTTLTPIFSKDFIADLPEEHMVKVVPIQNIKPRTDQPRKNFDEKAHQELVTSIKLKGIIQPIVVCIGKNKDYEIVVGERRWRAARDAGLTTIPVIVKDYSKQEIMIVALMENIHRQDLNVIEEAMAIQALSSEFSFTHEELAGKLGKARTTITNLLRLLSLSDEVKSLLERGLIEAGHAKVLLSLDSKIQVEIANTIVKKQLTVRQAEELVKNLERQKNIEASSQELIDGQLLNRLRVTLSEKLNSKVSLTVTKSGQSRVVIHFDDLETLNSFIVNIPEKKKKDNLKNIK